MTALILNGARPGAGNLARFEMLLATALTDSGHETTTVALRDLEIAP